MATAVVIPKLGNTVESCIIVEWKKAEGDSIQQGETICDIETDKAIMEVESPASGVVLALFYAAGADVPVMTNIAAVGEPGEDASDLRPGGLETSSSRLQAASPPAEAAAPEPIPVPEPAGFVAISPRARHLAERESVDASGLAGTGPGGRIIERDVQAAISVQPRLSPVAKAMVERGGFQVPAQGSGPGGRIMSKDLVTAPARPAEAPAPAPALTPSAQPDDVAAIPLKGVRKVIAERMLASLQTTAQLTLNASADARQLQALRARFKASPDSLGLQRVTINDLLLFAVARTLPQHRDLNALFENETVYRYGSVHLALAVDTPRGLLVPVIRNAQLLSLKQISNQAKRLAETAQSGRIHPDELTGGTFTVTNLGGLGVESFTPVLNPPQVAILGVNNINLKPVDLDGQVQFLPHIGLSLTINHQVVDGAPAARFLQALAQNLANIDLLLAA